MSSHFQDDYPTIFSQVRLDAFRLSDPVNPFLRTTEFSQEIRQTTSLIGSGSSNISDPCWQALASGLGMTYYSIAISYKQQ